MEQDPGKTCEGCGLKKATHHFCQPGAEPPSISLCEDCIETHAPALARVLMEEIKNAVCCYCGNKAMTTDSLTRIVDGMDADTRYLCFSCSAESNRVAMEKIRILESELESLPFSEQTKRLREFRGEIDAHMRRWVIQRDN